MPRYSAINNAATNRSMSLVIDKPDIVASRGRLTGNASEDVLDIPERTTASATALVSAASPVTDAPNRDALISR